MIRPCAAEGCPTLTMGGYCLEHERELAAASKLAAQVEKAPLKPSAVLVPLSLARS